MLSFNNPFGFTGYQTDDISGLHYAQARYYSPTVGRFTAEDPLRDELNWYGYCGGNPVNFVDPTGLNSRSPEAIEAMQERFAPREPREALYQVPDYLANGITGGQIWLVHGTIGIWRIRSEDADPRLAYRGWEHWDDFKTGDPMKFISYLARALGKDVYEFSWGEGIEEVLGAQRLCGVEVFANDLLGEPHISPHFAYSSPACSKSFGLCGNCKQICIDIIRQKVNRKIIFIGDGLTDRCVAEKADLLFAKHDLARYCKGNGLSYQPYHRFSDVTKYLKKWVK